MNPLPEILGAEIGIGAVLAIGAELGITDKSVGLIVNCPGVGCVDFSSTAVGRHVGCLVG